MLELDYYEAAPEALESTEPLNEYLEGTDFAESLLELVYLRTSQINGCAYCVDLHSRRLRHLGKNERYISSVVTWPEAPFYTDRERAALGWAEAVTTIPDGIPEGIAETARDEFDDQELVELTLAIGKMNLFNRLAISFGRTPPVKS